jgi:hypothetical protein
MGRTTRANAYIPGGGPVVAGQRGREKTARATGIAILADELEWRALAEDNPLFEFADYESYLLSVEKRMRAAARAGRQVMVGLLMPDQFETRADAMGLARESPRALKEYERFVADLGPFTRPWRGEPIAQVLERLRAHVRAETLQARAMPTLGAAAALHPHPDESARRATSQASHVLMAVIEGCGDGQHEARIKVSHPEGDLEYTLPYTKSAEVIAFPDDGGEQMAIVLLAIASLAERPGSMVLRSRPQIDFFPSRGSRCRERIRLARVPRTRPARLAPGKRGTAADERGTALRLRLHRPQRRTRPARARHAVPLRLPAEPRELRMLQLTTLATTPFVAERTASPRTNKNKRPPAGCAHERPVSASLRSSSMNLDHAAGIPPPIGSAARLGDPFSGLGNHVSG